MFLNGKYRIAYLAHGVRNIGGGEYVLYNLIKNLRRDIFEPIIFYSHENDIIRRLGENGVRLVKVSLDEKITSVYRDEIKKNPVTVLMYFIYLAAGVLEINKALKSHKVDILHPHDNLSKIIGGLAVLFTKCKIVAHCHDQLKETMIEKMLLLYQLLFIDRIIAVSENVRKIFTVFGRLSNKVIAIYNGIDINIFNPTIKNDFKDQLGLRKKDVVVGIIAVFDKCKGHDFLFNAVKQVLAGGTNNIVCLVIGDGRERDDLKGFVINENLEEHIRFLGYRNDVIELLNIIDVVVIPSLQESFGMVALESMAMEVPVIATTVGGLPEIIEDGKTGILVPPADIDALHKALIYLIKNRDIRKKMGEAGRERVLGKFSADNNVRKTEEVYLDVLKADDKTY
jgi:glycosyltransferase involved in cell wall biosynthesis